MKYLLLLALTGFLSWPYYHRMRSFKFSVGASYALALIPSFMVAFGIAKAIVDLNNGSFIGLVDLPDMLTKITYVVFWCILSGVFCWLMFTAEWMNDSTGWSSDGAFYFAVCLFAICVLQAFFVTDLLIKTIMEFS